MIVLHSVDAKAVVAEPRITAAIESISATFLREIVETISVPRHFRAEADNNRLTAHWIAQRFRSYGYQTEFQGSFANVVALPRDNEPCVLIGAHYDSMPDTPGADDNASAVAAMLACAKAVAAHARYNAISFVSFNREEENLMGSVDFVQQLVLTGKLRVRLAHILEMVGYCDHRPGSQSLPPGLPIRIPDTGDFLGILGNKDSTAAVDTILSVAKTYRSDFPVLSLKVYAGMEKFFPVLSRSDHAPFWKAGIPAVMWTDTSEFRNSNYHQPTDTPETLDYEFLRKVTQVLLASALTK